MTSPQHRPQFAGNRVLSSPGGMQFHQQQQQQQQQGPNNNQQMIINLGNGQNQARFARPQMVQTQDGIRQRIVINTGQQQQQQQQQMHMRQPDHHTFRRATFPYVRHDLPQHHIPHHPQFYDQYPSMYNEPLTMSPDPSESHHPHDPQSIKLEDTPLIVPSQLGFTAHPLHGHHHPGFLPPGAGGSVPIQHTDDAASKETQYLRRRCFNCHTTEPPSWRRSTLNPGKIVCNKCGLYERTHLRPRPLRFDELRAGGKTRKPGEKKIQKPAPLAGSPQIKKEPREFGLARRSSVSSTASSGGAVSDWDDNGKRHYFYALLTTC